MVEKITKQLVTAIKPEKGKDVYVWDSQIKGFGVRVKPSGARSFVVSYYAPGLHQKKRRMTLGVFGPLTVEEGRKRALEALTRVSRGEDPAAEAAQERRFTKERTVAALFPAYLEASKDLRRTSTLAYYQSLGRHYVLPALGELPVARVTPAEIAELHRSMRTKKVTANRVVQLLKSFFYWLDRQGLHSGENPATRVDFYPEKPKERFLTVEEVGRLGEALRAAETVGLEPAPQHRKPPSTKRRRNAGMFGGGPQPANPVAVAAIRFLLFTGWREQEALTLRWDALDLTRGMATLQDTKTGRSTRPLSAPAIELITSQTRLEGSPFVFPGKVTGKPLKETQRLWYAVRLAAGLNDVRLHDLRHSVASIAAAQGHSLYLISQLLGHKDLRSSARYAHFTDDSRKAVADLVGMQIDSALHPKPTYPPLRSKELKLHVLR